MSELQEHSLRARGNAGVLSSTHGLRILCVSPIPPIARVEIERHFVIEDADPATLSSCVSQADVILVGPPLKVDQAFLDQLPASVGAIATYSVGLDHINLDAVWVKGLALFNTPSVLANAVADHAMLLMLAATRRLTETSALLREGRWTDMNSNQILGIELAGKTLGIFGMGDIGSRVAHRATAFGMSVIYHSRKPAWNEAGARFIDTADQLVEQADVLLLASPSTPETRDFLDSRRISMAREGMVVINISRGDLIDDDALVTALETGRVRSAALDVFRDEPHVDPRYIALPNVVLTPHVGSATEEARRGMAATLCDAIKAWQRGKSPINQVV